MKLYQMYDRMYQAGHYLFDYQLKGQQKAATVEIGGEYAVFLDTRKIDTIAEETCAIAHELGHCETGTTHNIYSPYDLIARHEKRANKWAVNHILPPDKIKKAMQSGYSEAWQLSEYFDLPEEFILMAIQMYDEENISWRAII